MPALTEGRVEPHVRVLACPNCGGAVALRASGASVSAVCSSCGCTIDVVDDAALQVIAAAQAATRTPPIAIGSRAELVGTLWEVIGWQVRSEPSHGWSWDEYLLFNPYAGFRFLVHDDPDWVLYAMLRQDVPDPGTFEGRSYRPLRSGQSRTDYVLGEFYWRVRVGDVVDSQEFESPPYLLSLEMGAEEITWSRGVQLSSGTVRLAFGLGPAAVPPTRQELSQRQRSFGRAVWAVWAGATVLLLGSSQLSLDPNHAAVVFSSSLQAVATDKGSPIVGDAFVVPGGGGSLAIETDSDVSNGWVDLGWSLVDQATQRTLAAATALSEYHGSDSDGSWTEGASSGSSVLARVPGGTYRLLVDIAAPVADPADPDRPPARVRVQVVRHVDSPLNFWLALLALLPYPVWRLLVDRARPAGGKA